jgi:hypothetical protein
MRVHALQHLGAQHAEGRVRRAFGRWIEDAVVFESGRRRRKDPCVRIDKGTWFYGHVMGDSIGRRPNGLAPMRRGTASNMRRFFDLSPLEPGPIQSLTDSFHELYPEPAPQAQPDYVQRPHKKVHTQSDQNEGREAAAR